MNIADLLTYSLATYRGTKLVMDDEITRELREEALTKLDLLAIQFPQHRAVFDKLEYLLGCPWCVSIWISSALVILRRISPATADMVVLVLATSAVTGLAKVNEYRLGLE